jgi:regulation of enolase protein 1 (concanavalin A-like superfamily)
MRDRVVWCAAALLIGLVACGLSQAQPGVNLLTNGGFESGQIGPYGIYGSGTGTVVTSCDGAAVPEKPVEGKYCLHVVVPAAGANNWDVGMTDGSHSFEQGKKYTFCAFMKTKSGTLQVRLKPERGADPWEAYNEAVVTVTDKWQEFYVTTPVISATVTPASPTFHFAFAPGDFWIDGVRLYEGDYVKPTFLKVATADEPGPAVDATDVPRDPVLSWKAGPYAATHNVYFGTSFDDVNNAGISQAVSKGQAGTTFKPTDLLEYGKTYYWRVDEVNAAPSNTVFKGEVWNFTAEPYSYPITGIVATASSFEKSTTVPANTVNGSGLTGDLHGVNTSTMWNTAMGAATPAWIQFQFPSTYKLSELWVWNYNGEFEPVLGYGFKDVTIEYSLDGQTWTLLKDTQFAQATAVAGYAHNTTVDMGGVVAQYVKLTANSNWSAVGIKQYGLSEVRFFYIPVQARAPQPTGTEASVDSSLDWRSGRDMTSEQVYFGTDKAAVADGTATAKTVTSHGFDPGSLDFGTTYYWKVDEVGTATYPGAVWSFTTQEFAPVDDFESYTDEEGNRIYETWIDGWTNGTGSVVGYLQSPFAETVIVHGGNQAMPFEYNNVKTPYYSETERTFDTPQDWTTNGADSVALWYQGFPTGFTDKGGNAYTVVSTGTDIWNNADQFRFAFKSLSGNGSITARVDSLTRSDPWSKAGVMIRESLEPGSKHVTMAVTPDNSCSLQYRNSTGGASNSTNWSGTAVQAPYWVRITRTGNSFKGETSPDGKTWTALGADQNITMVSNVYIGLAVTSHNASAYSTAEFSNVTTSGTGSWQNMSIGVTQRSNGIAPLYVTVEDKAGKKKTVVNPDAAAVTKGTWTQWQIPLTDLTGVNAAAVKKLTIGVGDPANPQAGAAGMLYIDDIQYGKPRPPVTTPLIVNGGFETGVQAPWGAWGGGGATLTATVVTACTGAAVPEGPIEGKYCLNVKVSAASTNFWDCAFNIAPPTFEKGRKYTLSAFFKTKSGTGKVNMKPEHAADPWEGYGEQQVTITDTWTEYHVTTPVFTSDVSPTSLTFHVGFQAQEFWVDNVKWYEGDYVPTN